MCDFIPITPVIKSKEIRLNGEREQNKRRDRSVLYKKKE